MPKSPKLVHDTSTNPYAESGDPYGPERPTVIHGEVTAPEWRTRLEFFTFLHQTEQEEAR
jgi:hypothetical protein